MKGYTKTGFQILSWLQSLALAATMFTPPTKFKLIAYGISASLLIGEKCYNAFRSPTDYRFSKNVLGLVGIGATFLSKPNIPLWNIPVSIAVGALTSPVPYRWLNRLEENDTPKNIYATLKRQVSVQFENLTNPWSKEKRACYAALLIPTAMCVGTVLLPGIFFPRYTLPFLAYTAFFVKDNIFTERPPYLGGFGARALETFSPAIDRFFSNSNNKDQDRSL